MLTHDGVLTPVPYTRERLELAKEALVGLDLFGLQDRFEDFCDELAERYGLDVGEAVRSNTTGRSRCPTASPTGSPRTTPSTWSCTSTAARSTGSGTRERARIARGPERQCGTHHEAPIAH